MLKEQFLRAKISSRYSYREFARVAGLPYSTLQSILHNVDGASFSNVTKICRGLNMSLDTLADLDELTEKELMKILKTDAHIVYNKETKKIEKTTPERKLKELMTLLKYNDVSDDQLKTIMRLMQILPLCDHVEILRIFQITDIITNYKGECLNKQNE